MKIFYGVQATGRGHVSRYLVARGILMEAGHAVASFASGQGLPSYADSSIDRFEPGPTFVVDHNRIALIRTFLHNATRLPRFLGLIRELSRDLRAAGYDHAIIDFEPLSARAARRAGIPTVLFDNQTAALLDTPIPAELRVVRSRLRGFVRAYYGGCRWPRRIITYSLIPATPRYEHQLVVPPCVRVEIDQLQPTDGSHLLYYRSVGALPRGLVDFAKSHPNQEIRVYAPHAGEPVGLPDNIRLRAHDNRRFLDDFASCRAYITGAGFESVAEAIALSKPLIVSPIAGQWEQQINAHLIQECGIGEVIPDLSAASFERALSHSAPAAPEVRRWVAGGRKALQSALLNPL